MKEETEKEMEKFDRNTGVNKIFKGVLNPNFRPFSFKLKKLRFFEINFDLGFRVL